MWKSVFIVCLLSPSTKVFCLKCYQCFEMNNCSILVERPCHEDDTACFKFKGYIDEYRIEMKDCLGYSFAVDSVTCKTKGNSCRTCKKDLCNAAEQRTRESRLLLSVALAATLLYHVIFQALL